jgi:hypothetical protein
MRSRVLVASLLAALLPSCEATEIIYGSVVYPNFGAFIATTPPGSLSQPVGIQSNGWSRGSGETWGIATEAIAFDQSTSILIGLENLVVNTNAQNTSRKIANNAVFRCSYGSDPCTGQNNYDSIAYWVSAGVDTGFESGLKFDGQSLSSLPGRPQPAAIDLRDVPMDKLKTWCVIALSDGICITATDLYRLKHPY